MFDPEEEMSDDDFDSYTRANAALVAVQNLVLRQRIARPPETTSFSSNLAHIVYSVLDSGDPNAVLYAKTVLGAITETGIDTPIWLMDHPVSPEQVTDSAWETLCDAVIRHHVSEALRKHRKAFRGVKTEEQIQEISAEVSQNIIHNLFKDLL